jgi:hypothetical protein
VTAMMNEYWIKRYFPEEKYAEVLDTLSEYGKETWQREEERVKRDVLIISRGSIDALKSAIKLAMIDYRDILIGEAVDPWVIQELKNCKS